MRFHLLTLLILAGVVNAAEDPFKANVRPTEPLSPAGQQTRFHLPEGFEIQLVAAEPDLRKPMNMAFDSAGRLWVTESREYPNAAPTNSRPRDTIRIFSDFDTNGHARSVSTFATNLNIPIGLHPFRSANTNTGTLTWKCVAWSIPNIWLFEDADGDGAADTSRMLYGPFDFTRDTHGNQASFRRGDDGWVYATHGFNNHSRVAGADGHEIELVSGNTYRFRLDGSRIEKWTHGQVNPFGLAFDQLGNLFSADCHSSPIYQLLRGACYPSFGRPDDGLGFAPLTIRHSHGSTAIAGLVLVQDPDWPAAFQDNILVGNVMTSRINRDRIEWRGATTLGHEAEDFLRCDDPWFRPVDLQWGPDGALYVADFYNRIIGHYEVPRDHPGRDRERGRIWRIVHRGKNPAKAKENNSRRENLLTALTSSNPKLRSLSLNEICDVLGRNSATDLRALLGSPNEFHHASALWGLHRMRLLSERDLLRALITPSTLPRLAALRISGELTVWTDNVASVVSKTIHAENAHLRRIAAETLGLRTNRNDVAELVSRHLLTEAEDTHLRHSLRISLRNQLATGGEPAFDEAAKWSDDRRAVIRDIAVAVNTPAAAAFLLNENPGNFTDMSLRARAWKHIAKHAPQSRLTELVTTLRKEEPDQPDTQIDLIQTIRAARPQPDKTLAAELKGWADQIAAQLLSKAALENTVWGNLPPDTLKNNENPWTLQERKSQDGVTTHLLSSHPLGERLRGRLRSKTFDLPARLSFFLCGHDGVPGKEARNRNLVRLRLAASDRILHEAPAPRHDTARLIEWDLKEFAGRKGYFEAVDALADSSYAWLAFGRFQPPLPELALSDVSRQSDHLAAGADLAGEFKLQRHAPALRRLLTSPNAGFDPLRSAAESIARFHPDKLAGAAAKTVGDLKTAEPLRQRFALALALAFASPTNSLADAFRESFRTADTRGQARLAASLAGSTAGAELLLDLIEKGTAAPRLLGDADLRQRLEASDQTSAKARIAKLRSAMPPDDTDREKIVRNGVDAYRASKANPGKGREIFATACAACHQIAGQGRLVGPQLDGIGGRGLDRVIEDILAPNLNVDVAFRIETIRLKNGDVITGLPRREQEGSLVLANSAGAEQSVPLADIDQRAGSSRSLMPDNFHEALTPGQLRDLVGFLLAN
ncbi:MAG: c-type cytochrome [Verrucomicrobiae bacterium]|nr:c-type cytochrome [Verrucomicrobiae bacterium]